MAYDNQYSNRRFEYAPRHEYMKPPYKAPYRQDFQAYRQPKKHSGAKITVMRRGKSSGEECIVAWNYSRGKGLMKLLITPYKNTADHTSGKGVIWRNYVCKVTYDKSGHEKLTSALVEIDTRGGIIKAIVNDLGFVVNPKAPNGGYCGTFKKRN